MDWIANQYGDSAKFDEMLDAMEARYAGTRYIGDAVPMPWFNMGPGVLAAYLTGFLRFVGDTTWFELEKPLSWDEIMKLELDGRGEWYAKTKETERVAEAVWHCNRHWKRVFDELTALFDAEGNEGYGGWMGIWSDKPWYPLQCEADKWFPLYERIGKGGKARVLRSLPLSSAARALDSIGGKNTLLTLWGSEKEALKLARQLGLPEG